MGDDPLLDEMLDLIPQELRDVSGAVLYSGRDACTGSSALYLMGSQPGGDPTAEDETAAAQVARALLGEPANYSTFRDDSWGNDAHPPGESRMQLNVMHLLSTLGLDPGRVPGSNMVFARAHSEEDIPREQMSAWAEACWPFHRWMIERLGVRVVVCFGRTAGAFVCKKLGAQQEVDRFVESNNRGWTSRGFRAPGGLTVVQTTSPSRAVWLNPDADVSPLVARALNRN